MSGYFLEADGPEGALFAFVDPQARYCEAGVGTRKFAASLHPHQTDERARLALIRAGGKNVRPA